MSPLADWAIVASKHRLTDLRAEMLNVRTSELREMAMTFPLAILSPFLFATGVDCRIKAEVRYEVLGRRESANVLNEHN